jgi:ATP-dependent Clp protease ATP-binding subunit ClpX
MIAHFRMLVRFYGADLVFTDGAVKEIAKISLERGTGARGLRSVLEEVLEGVLFEAEAGIRYVITEATVRVGKAVRQSMALPRAPLSDQLRRRLMMRKS